MKTVLKLTIVLALVLVAVAVVPTAAQDANVVQVGTNAEFPPFESVDEDGNIIGFDIDLMDAIAADAGFEVEYINTRWDGIFVALSEGEFDAVISAATITEEREEIVDFSDPYFNAGQNITVAADLAEDVAGPEDLAGLRVGVQANTTGDTYASGLDGVEVVRLEEATLAFQALGAGEVDAVIVDAPVAIDILANNPDIEAQIVGDPLTDEFYGIAVNAEQPDLLDTINTSLANLIADGTYAEIYMEWFGQNPPSDFMGGEMEGDDMAEEGEDGAGDMAEEEVDFTDPEAVATAIVAAFFSAESPDDLLVFACEGAGDSPLLPDQETIDQFAGISADLSEFTVTAEVDGDVAVVTFDEDAIVTLVIGETETPLPASVLAMQVGIESITLRDVDGRWLICPAEGESE